MEKGLKELLESNVLSDDTKTALTEAWNKKTEELRESVKKEVVADFKARFDEDKMNLSIAMNDMLGEAVKKYATESGEEVKRLKEERKKLSKAAAIFKEEQKQKIEESALAMEDFVTNELMEQVKMLQKLVAECLKEELGKIARKEEELDEAKKSVTRRVREHRMKLNKQAAEHIHKLDEFVVHRLEEELAEFQEDKRELVETRARVMRNYKRKLAETKKSFISKATKIVESSVNNSLKEEMSKMKKDIKAARENTFARKIYESFKDEFKSGYLRDHEEMNEMVAEMRNLRRQVSEATREANEQRKLAESAKMRARMNEDRALRSKVMSDLLRPLSKDKRTAMENLLESTKTANLKDAFHRYLPTVLDENVNKNNGRRALLEGSTSRTVTGNKVSRLNESAEKDNQADDPERLALLKLAGIRKD